MIRVGLTGGIGTGKTRVAEMFAALGCHAIDADSITRDLFRPGEPVQRMVAAAFGPEVVGPEGGIDRKALGALVFNNEEMRLKLNAIVHPAIKERQKAFLDVAEAADPNGIGIVEAALMVEAGTYRNYDKLIVVTTTSDIQFARLRERTGLSDREIEARIAAQMPLDEKAKFADYLIDNSGSSEETERQVRKIHEVLRNLAARGRN